jgi:hypothetical protein
MINKGSLGTLQVNQFGLKKSWTDNQIN